MSKRYDTAAATFYDLMGQVPIDNPFPVWQFRERKFWQEGLEELLDQVRSGQLSKAQLRDYLPNFGDTGGGDWIDSINYPH